MTFLTRVLVKVAALYIRRTPDHWGRWRLERWVIVKSSVLRGYLSPRVVRTRLGFEIFVDGDSKAGRILYATGRYEEPIARLFGLLTRTGDCVVDGGAHIGFFSILAARRVGSEGRVWSFEPTPTTVKRLQANLDLNHCQNVSVRQEALSDGPGRAVLSLASVADTGQATLRSLPNVSRQDSVRLVALDDVLAGGQTVALVKLDLEGAELAALRGMRRILTACRPHIIVEVTDEFLRRVQGSAAELYDYLVDFGYKAYVIEANGLKNIDSRQEFTDVAEQFNALFTVTPPTARFMDRL